MNDQPVYSRTEIDDVLRSTLEELTNIVTSLEIQWHKSDPVQRGNLWMNMRLSAVRAKKALAAVPDPKPGTCGYVWHDDLDGVWDRCGRLLHHKGNHKGNHKALYLMKAEENG